MRIIKKYICIPAVAVAALAWGCSSDGGECPSGMSPTDDGGLAAIVFRAGSELDGSLTRAGEPVFPNNSIGVSATYDGDADWWSYGDINDAIAGVAGVSSGVFTFEFQETKYWPLDGAKLNFAAYSPHTSEATGLTLLNDLTTLQIDLNPDLPDVMYATGNSLLTPWDKSTATVDLGTFNHALSRLIVNVAGDDVFNEEITIESLQIVTTLGSGYLDLLEANDDDNLSLIYNTGYTYFPVGSSTDFSQASPYSTEVYLFPGTADQTKIIITLKDGPFSVTGEYLLSEIVQDKDDESDPDEYLSLVRAYVTTVNIVVKSTLVENPDDSITLQGALTEWDDPRELEVTIN
ncbi:MAG: fimbrillin family protein [Alistipes sp.]|nr:fimbrillin family protein [Alistipes sp.]